MFKIYEALLIARNICDDKRGVTALEYGLIAAIIGSVLATGATYMSGGLTEVFNEIGNRLRNTNG